MVDVGLLMVYDGLNCSGGLLDVNFGGVCLVDVGLLVVDDGLWFRW